jgi:hypothetical protein
MHCLPSSVPELALREITLPTKKGGEEEAIEVA